jgi:hypothetical protein
VPTGAAYRRGRPRLSTTPRSPDAASLPTTCGWHQGPAETPPEKNFPAVVIPETFQHLDSSRNSAIRLENSATGD